MAFWNILRPYFCFMLAIPLILDHQGFVVSLSPSFTGQGGEVAQGRSACSAGLSTEPPSAMQAESPCAPPKRVCSDALCLIRE